MQLLYRKSCISGSVSQKEDKDTTATTTTIKEVDIELIEYAYQKEEEEEEGWPLWYNRKYAAFIWVFSAIMWVVEAEVLVHVVARLGARSFCK